MITIYTKTTCPYCVKAKNYLQLKRIPFNEINIEQDEISRQFLKSQGHTTVPQLYKNNKNFVVGGCDGLLNLSETELFKKVNA